MNKDGSNKQGPYKRRITNPTSSYAADEAALAARFASNSASAERKAEINSSRETWLLRNWMRRRKSPPAGPN